MPFKLFNAKLFHKPGPCLGGERPPYVRQVVRSTHCNLQHSRIRILQLRMKKLFLKESQKRSSEQLGLRLIKNGKFSLETGDDRFRFRGASLWPASIVSYGFHLDVFIENFSNVKTALVILGTFEWPQLDFNS